MLTYIITIIISIISATILQFLFLITAPLYLILKNDNIIKLWILINQTITFIILSYISYKVFDHMDEYFDKKILIILWIIFWLNTLSRIYIWKRWEVFYLIWMIIWLIIWWIILI